MIFSKERVSDKQVDELSRRLFTKRGVINLDKNDLWSVLGHKDGVLLSAQQENEDSTTFMRSFLARLAEAPELKQSKSILFYFGNSTETPMYMSDLSMVGDVLAPYPEMDCIWGIQKNDEGVGLSAVAVFSVERE